ncbi:oxidoreductase, FAD-binding [Streptomyces sp. e14]|uniref:D-arabinono-1,4-lactone oxidase n=1 Tax=Streptomyces sp. e14 TaxID=645465 RepID=UPI0001D05E34|nr:D-arabinono-1,4-lactone oxidase [Streptomyces sp. e14]EFF88768.1 oxidoreductase, FAD-binding [Streptomyces sp. e14]
MAEKWRNWAGQQTCAPTRIERPASEEQLSEVVARAVRDGLRVRPVGSGHSFTDACLTDGVMVDQSGMQRVLDVDPVSGLVTVEAGIKLHRLTAELHRYGLALENQGDIDKQSLAGALATATHGTGERFCNLSANVVGCRLVTATGEVVEIDEARDPDAWRAARVSVGALGVISRYTLRCVPAFRIRRIDEIRPAADVLADLDRLVAAHDHFEVLALPHTDKVLTYASRRTDRPAAPPGRVTAWWNDDVVSNVGLGVACHLGRLLPGAAPGIARTLTRVIGRYEQLDDSYRVFAHQRRVRFTEMEYAIPRVHAAEALERVRALIVDRRLPVLFPIELRFTAPDDAFLSTAYGRDTAYLAVHHVVRAEYEAFFRAVEAIMDEYEGRPHWGKRHFQTATTLAPRYPGWQDFQAVRARLDPDGVFTNDYVARVLGPVGVGRAVTG